MPQKDPTLSDEAYGLIHKPDELTYAWIEKLKRINSPEGMLKWGLPTLDNNLMRLKSPDVHLWIGRTGMGKTTLMTAFMKNLRAQLKVMNKLARQQDPKALKKIIALVTWETVTEDYEMLMAADDSLNVEQMLAANVSDPEVLASLYAHADKHPRVLEPIWVVGSREYGVKAGCRVRASFDVVSELLRHHARELSDPDSKIEVIVVDYIQRAPVITGQWRAGESQVRLSINETMNALDKLAQELSCIIFVAAQAKQTVDDNRVDKVPQGSDVAESNDPEKVAAGVYGIYFPSKDHKPSVNNPETGQPMPDVYGNLFVITPRKQRQHGVGKQLYLSLDPRTAIMRELDQVTGKLKLP